MALIGIIIPCYYNSYVIKPCLESIALQKAKDKIRVYLVNDCSPNTNCEYADLIDEYKTKIDLKYFKTKANVGPGGARQLGLENIDEDIQYIMFVDDDDQLDNPDSIQSYIDILDNSSENIGFLAGQRTVNNIDIQECGLTGSLFNYSIISMFNIQFKNYFYEEDSIFLNEYFMYMELLNLNKIIDKKYIYKPIQKKIYNYYSNHDFSLTHQEKYNSIDKIWNLLFINYNFCKSYYNLNINYNTKKLIKNHFFNVYLQICYMTQIISEKIINLEELYNLIIINNMLINVLNKFNISILDNDLDNIYVNLFEYNSNNYIKYNLEDYKLYLDTLYSFLLDKIKNNKEELNSMKKFYINQYEEYYQPTQELSRCYWEKDSYEQLLAFLINNNMRDSEDYIKLWIDYIKINQNNKLAINNFSNNVVYKLIDKDKVKNWYYDFNSEELTIHEI